MTSYPWSQMFTYRELHSPSISEGREEVKVSYRLWSQAALATVCHVLFSLSLSLLICAMVILKVLASQGILDY